ncbi:MAG: pyruvate ferredoxin oxidoreductase [Deltaproteobacteria bacterium HGW-Deltaproteobacteria-6]|nr:MAG: pyruvate ferredoxin oxidoreductase [Deltaproteobacteria bacterium HGW-Deltaproteobacteria-6]
MHIIENGNVAAALGVKLCRANVIAAYPITPQTPLTERLSEFVEAGEMKSEYIPVESEHSALAVCIAASSTGARAFTATSSNGLLYMHEQVQWAAGARLPIVMCVVNRAISAPWNVWNDQQDSISQRDTGWIQMYCADHQQIIDTVIKAYWLAEKVSIPIMVCYDGYILSHTYMPFDVPDQKQVDAFLPPFKPEYALNPEDPANLNTVTLPDVRMDVHGELAHGYMEIRYLLHEELRAALAVAAEAEKRFTEIFGRGGDPYLEPYRCDDAEYIAVGLGSLTYQLRVSVDALRKEGIKVGVMGVRFYRPFPDEAIANALKGKKGVIVFEKALSYGYEGALASDLKSALYEHLASTGTLPAVQNFIVGIGGRDIRTEELTQNLKAATQGRVSKEPTWIGLKL